MYLYIVACHLPRAPSYGGVRTWVEGSQMRGYRVLAIAIELPIIALNTRLTDYLFPYKTNERVGHDNIVVCHRHCLWWYGAWLDCYRPRSEGDNALGSVRPSVRPSVRLSVRPSVCQRSHGWTVKSYRSHCQSKVLVCVSIISRHMRVIARMRSIGF